MNHWIAPGLRSHELAEATKDRESRIFETVCDIFKVTAEEMFGKCRKRNLVEPRQIIMYLLYNKTARNLKSIGRLMNRDHATVIYAKNTVKDLIDTDKLYKAQIEYLEKIL